MRVLIVAGMALVCVAMFADGLVVAPTVLGIVALVALALP